VSVILGKILIAIVAKLGGEMLRVALKTLYNEYMRQRASLTPEQRKEWDRDWVKDFQSNEGSLPETPGIVIENAIDPYKGDGKAGE
jgi:hypothetical protein